MVKLLHERQTWWHVGLRVLVTKNGGPVCVFFSVSSSVLGVKQFLGEFSEQKCSRVHLSEIGRKIAFGSGSDRLSFYDIFNSFARAILSYFPPLNLFSLRSTKQGHISLPRPRPAFTTQVFSTILRNERELASFVLPSLRTTTKGGPRRGERRERPARPLASSHLLASTNALVPLFH